MLWLTVHETVINNRLNFQGRLIRIFTCVSYAEARNSYRLDVRPSVRPSVTRWYCIKMAEHIVMLSSPHDSHSSFVCIKDIREIPTGSPPVGAPNRGGVLGYDKTGDISETRASINRSIQRAINLVRRSTAINTLATAVCIYR